MANYEQIKTLTIDGTTMGMKEGLGLTYLAENERQGAVSSGTEYNGASYTFTKKGAYIVRSAVTFPTAETTGVTRHSMSIVISNNTRLMSRSQIDGTNGTVVMGTTGVVNVPSPPETITVRFECSKNIAANAGLKTQLRVSQIVRVPQT